MARWSRSGFRVLVAGFPVITFVLCARVVAEPSEALEARYRVLSADKGRVAPFSSVIVRRSSSGSEDGRDGHIRWDLVIADADTRLLELRCETRSDPMRSPWPERLGFRRYLLKVPATGEIYDYRSVHGDRALLPMWHEFERWAFPRPTRGTEFQSGFANTCELLGHVLTLREVRSVDVSAPWDTAQVLRLDDELLVGTSRTFRDREGHRLPQTPERRNYDYVTFTLDDYRALVDAGHNTFALVRGIEAEVRSLPVFYRRGPSGDAPIVWPTDFYRSNFRGSLMYEDEPACILVGEEAIHRETRFFTDVTALLAKRNRSRYSEKSRAFGSALRSSGVAFGDLVLEQRDWAVWETRYETAFYQLEAAFQGFVHEGRYRLDDFYESGVSFDEYVRASTGLERRHTADEMLRYVFSFLRGAARHFDKDWGISIYGQADPTISPLAVRLAYDMGARYVWFWTSDHGHHLPFPEQLALARHLREHAATSPRPSIRGPRPVLDRALVVPYGWFPTLESPTGRRHHWDLWWVRELDREGRSEAAKRFRSRMRALLAAVHEAFDAGANFDVVVDDGREPRGYREVIRIEEGVSSR